jgi:hypothetical protein
MIVCESVPGQARAGIATEGFVITISDGFDVPAPIDIVLVVLTKNARLGLKRRS